ESGFCRRFLDELKLSLGLALFSFHRLQKLGGEFIALSGIVLLSNLGCNLSPRPYGVCAIDHNRLLRGILEGWRSSTLRPTGVCYHPSLRADNVATIASLGQDSIGQCGGANCRTVRMH